MAARPIRGEHLFFAAVLLLACVWVVYSIVASRNQHKQYLLTIEHKRNRYLQGVNRVESSVELNFDEVHSLDDLERKLGDRDEESSRGLYSNETNVEFWGGLIKASVINGDITDINVGSSSEHPSSGYRGTLYGVHIGNEHDGAVKHLSASLCRAPFSQVDFSTDCNTNKNSQGAKSVFSCMASCGNIYFHWNEDNSRRVLQMSVSNGIYVRR